MTKGRKRGGVRELEFESTEGPKRITLSGVTAINPPSDEKCDCGRPLHYESKAARDRMERLVAQLGRTVNVKVEGKGTWEVPRHYIALHEIKPMEVPALAEHKGWKKVS